MGSRQSKKDKIGKKNGKTGTRGTRDNKSGVQGADAPASVDEQTLTNALRRVEIEENELQYLRKLTRCESRGAGMCVT